MAKRNYMPWSPIEERKLLRFLNRHQHLTWEQRAAKYCSEVNGGRTFESLRSKYAQLRRGIRRLRAIHRNRSHPTAQLTHYQQERVSNELSSMQVPDPPVLELKPRSQDIQAMLRLIERHQRHRPRTLPPPQDPHMSDMRWKDFATAPCETKRQARINAQLAGAVPSKKKASTM